MNKIHIFCIFFVLFVLFSPVALRRVLEGPCCIPPCSGGYQMRGSGCAVVQGGVVAPTTPSDGPGI